MSKTPILNIKVTDGMVEEFAKECRKGATDQEREALDDVADYIDIYYNKRRGIEKSGLEPGEWFDRFLTALTDDNANSGLIR